MQMLFALVVSVFLAAAGVSGQPSTATPPCVASCMSERFSSAGCNNGDFNCGCKIADFQKGLNSCFRARCNSDDASIGMSMVDSGCSNEASTSISPPFHTSTGTSLSITSSETSPPQSGSTSATASASGTSSTSTSRSGTTSISSTSQSTRTVTVVPSTSSTNSGSTTSSPATSSSATNSPVTSSDATSSGFSITTSRNVASGTSPVLTPSVPSGTIAPISTQSTSGAAPGLVNLKMLWVLGASMLFIGMM